MHFRWPFPGRAGSTRTQTSTERPPCLGRRGISLEARKGYTFDTLSIHPGLDAELGAIVCTDTRVTTPEGKPFKVSGVEDITQPGRPNRSPSVLRRRERALKQSCRRGVYATAEGDPPPSTGNSPHGTPAVPDIVSLPRDAPDRAFTYCRFRLSAYLERNGRSLNDVL